MTQERNIYLKNEPLDDALQRWEDHLNTTGFYGNTPCETITVDESIGRKTTQPVFALHSSPSYNAAAMDGIAVQFHMLSQASETTPVILDTCDFIFVNTGNNIPDQFNAVVMIEDVHIISDGRVELIHSATPWQHIRTIGEDIVATELILPEGHEIRPIDQGAMLAAGITKVAVSVSPNVCIIPTGSELIQPGETQHPGNIIEFNTRILGGYLEEWGAKTTRHSPVRDDRELLKKAIETAAAKNDIVVINAGASAGSKDFTSTVLAELGEIIVHGVAIKPGKPVMLAIVGSTPVIGLPGYPVSAFLTMRLFVKKMIYRFMGCPVPARQTLKATMSRPVYSPMGVNQYIRTTLGKVGDNLMATPSGKGAGAVMSLVRADGILSIPAGSEGVGPGEEVEIELLRSRGEIDSTLVSIGSHDNILDLIANHLYKLTPATRLSSAHVGSMGGIMAIRRNEAHIAGCHLLDERTGIYNVTFIQKFLKDIPLQLINLAYREQGFIVQKGNPKNIKSFSDIAANHHTFINRQSGAGTRLLTDKVLIDEGIKSNSISGYDHEEYTHMSVAAAVANQSVDCGMGIRAAAKALNLDFVPVTEERYDLIIPNVFITDIKTQLLLQLIREDKTFQKKVVALGGYNLRDIGKIMYEQ